MRFHKIVLTGMTAIASFGLAADAMAGGRNAGSLLLYPEFDNIQGEVSVITVTNVSATDSVEVEFMYIGRPDEYYEAQCEEFNRAETLTPNDTFTVITLYHNPQQEQGYAYVFAREGVGNPVVHNDLIGQVLTIDGWHSVEYSMNAVAYTGLAGDANGNGLRDLDGSEYEAGPDVLQVPRFFGQGGHFESELILIGLSGGVQFDTYVDFMIYNDNEVGFSAQYEFNCWKKVLLTEISGAFSQTFLVNGTNHDENESIGGGGHEYGWFEFTGHSASSTSTDIANPAIYGVMIEKIQTYCGSDLPWEAGTNANGKLLPRSLDGQS